MLKGLHLKNFKSWREANVTLAPITGFFGANSSGKSSLLQALLLMKQTVESSDQQQLFDFGNEKTYVDLGSYKNIIFQAQFQQKLSLGLKFQHKDNNFYLGTTVGFDKENQDSVISYGVFFELDGIIVDSSPNTKNGKFYSAYDEKNTHDPKGIIWKVDLFFEHTLSNLRYVGPLREPPKRTYLWSGSAPSNVGKSGENTVAALLAARAKGTLVNGQPLEVVISEKLQQLGLIHSFRLEELREGTNIFRVLLQLTPESPEVSLTDVGFGVSQLLPVLVLLYYVPEGSTIILEQPELHLHPSVQSGLADILIDAHKTRGVQILLESHSEHLLQRLQRRIAEESITPEDVKLYFCSLEHGESKLTPLELDEYGNIHNYPKDFFGDRFDEVAATAEAGIKRRLDLVGT